MATMMVKHRVADFGKWKQVFDGMTGARKEHGWTGHTVLRGADDPNVVVVVNRVKSLDDAKRYGGSDTLRKGMMEAGVQGPPDIWFLEQVEDKTY